MSVSTEMTKKVEVEQSCASSNDPHKFLEDGLNKESMECVKDKNKACISKFDDPTQTDDYKHILAVLDSKDKIPSVAQIGDTQTGFYYNYWQDQEHVQGIWRKTSLDSYQSENPEWQTVLDLNGLAPPSTDSASTWVWHGSNLLDEGPGTTCDRALIKLSPGGSDANITREMDLVSEKFIEEEKGGFAILTAAKTSILYRSRNEILIGTDFDGDGKTMTDSGYA